MPYLVERLRANKLFVEYDEQTEDLVYRLTASIAKGGVSDRSQFSSRPYVERYRFVIFIFVRRQSPHWRKYNYKYKKVKK